MSAERDDILCDGYVPLKIADWRNMPMGFPVDFAEARIILDKLISGDIQREIINDEVYIRVRIK